MLTTDVDPQKHEVQPTLSIVGYPDEVAEAMAFVFSNTCIRKKAMSSRRPVSIERQALSITSLDIAAVDATQGDPDISTTISCHS